MSKNQLYTFILTASLVGIGAVVYLFITGQGFGNLTTVCVFKNLTGLPCPSCGATRSVLSILNGNFSTAFHFNPIGYLLVALFSFPIWVLRDIILKQNSFFRFYNYCEEKLRQPQIYIPLVGILAVNWIWNFIKYT